MSRDISLSLQVISVHLADISSYSEYLAIMGLSGSCISASQVWVTRFNVQRTICTVDSFRLIQHTLSSCNHESIKPNSDLIIKQNKQCSWGWVSVSESRSGSGVMWSNGPAQPWIVIITMSTADHAGPISPPLIGHLGPHPASHWLRGLSSYDTITGPIGAINTKHQQRIKHYQTFPTHLTVTKR